MTKEAFFSALAAGLSGSADRDEILDFYAEMVADRMEDGMTEEEAVAQLGSVEEILSRCVQGLTVTKQERTQSGISRVEIREREFDVEILPTTEQTYRVETTDDRYHDITLENGVLRIVRTKLPQERRLFSFVSGSLTLYLPEGQVDTLDVTTASGDVEVKRDFGSVHITGASGEVSLTGSFPEGATVQTASGDVTLEGTFGGTVKIQTASGSQELRGRFASGQMKSASGDITADGAAFSGELHLETASGDLEGNNLLAGNLGIRTASGDVNLERVCAENLTLETRSGDMHLEQVLSKGDFLCKSTSGDVTMDGCDGARMVFSTVSGDISGSLLHSKRFTFHSVSGRISCPGGEAQGTCEISTVSGDAELETIDS